MKTYPDRARALCVLGLACLFLLLWPALSWAQPTGADKAAAEALFAQGKDLMGKQDYAEACKKFDASQKLDPAVGTLLFLGECNEKLGRTASAWAAFQEAASLAETTNDQKRKQIASVRLSALEPQVSKLQVNVLGDDPSGVTVRRDGVELPRASWGVALPIDAGEHTIEATAPNKQPFKKTVAVSDGGNVISLDVPELQDLAPQPAPVDPQPEPVPQPPPDVQQPEGGFHPLLITGIVVGGVGVIGLVVGGVFGAGAASKNDESLGRCRTEQLCTPEGVTLREDAQEQATIATVAFIAGGVLIAAGVTLMILAPSSDGDTAGIDSLEVAGPLLRGSF